MNKIFLNNKIMLNNKSYDEIAKLVNDELKQSKNETFGTLNKQMINSICLGELHLKCQGMQTILN